MDSILNTVKVGLLGFNEHTADLLEKKTRKSKKAFRMYYLDY